MRVMSPVDVVDKGAERLERGCGLEVLGDAVDVVAEPHVEA